MNNANFIPLSDLCPPKRSITYGIVQPGQLHDGGVPIVRVNNFRGHRLDLSQRLHVAPAIEANYRRSRPSPNDVLISLVGSIGQVAIAPPEIDGWNLARAVGLVPMIDRHHAMWVFYALQTPGAQAHFHRHANTTVQATFNLKDLAEFPIPYPEAKTREQVLEVLGTLDYKIELNRRMNETLEATAQAIFRDWFVDFGPTRRKIKGETNPVAIMGGLVNDQDQAQQLADLFPTALGDDGLPVGFGSQPFGFLLEDTIGGDWGKDAPEGADHHRVAIIRGTDFPAISSGGIGKVPLRYTNSKKLDRRKLNQWDIVVEVSGGSPTQPTGRSVLITQPILDRFDTDAVCASFCRRFRPKNKEASLLAFAHLTNLYNEGGTWKYQNQSTGISNFQTTHFLEVEQIVWGGTKLAEAFAGLVSPIAELRNSNESLRLAGLRDLLLPKLMSGEVAVRDAEVFA